MYVHGKVGHMYVHGKVGNSVMEYVKGTYMLLKVSLHCFAFLSIITTNQVAHRHTNDS